MKRASLMILLFAVLVLGAALVAAQGEGAHICNTFECNFTPIAPPPTAVTPDPVERGVKVAPYNPQPIPPLFTPVPTVYTPSIEEQLYRILVLWMQR